MKKIAYIALMIGFATISSCNKTDELPPKVGSSVATYVIPKGTIMTADERAIINARIAEYELATK